MASNFLDNDAMWRRCELAWSAWLEAHGYMVTGLGEAEGNAPSTRAPMSRIGGRDVRTPDIHASKANISEYWEVKYRSRPDVDQLTAERSYWMDYGAFRDYLYAAEQGGAKVWIVLYEAPTAGAPGRWLRVDVRDLAEWGRQTSRFGQGGEQILAWVWPVSCMSAVPGPTVPTRTAEPLPREGNQAPLTLDDFSPIERRLRSERSAPELGDDHTPVGSRVAAVLSSDAATGLDVLRQTLGIPVMPRYSVLVVGALDNVDEVLGFLHYGIRVFLITDENSKQSVMDDGQIEAFRSSRLLEWAVVPGLSVTTTFVVDGRFPDDEDSGLTDALSAADRDGALNVGQYRIVHAPADVGVLVTAGAGTGKTETISERIVFLLATEDGSANSGTSELRADEVVLMTFTREAAREMRKRISSALLLRRRLCNRCVLPIIGWVMQLSAAEISTIHTYAKRLAQASASSIGLGPNFRVSKNLLEFRQFLQFSLSPYLETLMDADTQGRIPAAHEWQKHLETLWETLENNGIATVALGGTAGLATQVDLGPDSIDSQEDGVLEATRQILSELSEQMRIVGVEDQSVSTGQLVPLALAAVTAQANPPVRRPKYLFVDEMQDTDATQMELILEVACKFGSPLFVVGDAKQGIYRFRGAEGNAFEELRKRIAERPELPTLTEFSLTTNFRTGSNLLESLNRPFSRWGADRLLTYTDRLRPAAADTDDSQPLSLQNVPRNQLASSAQQLVETWRSAEPDATIAVLCRVNSQAIEVQKAIRRHGGSCELLVGGSFYTTPAVRELRVYLDAVAKPHDDAALLELCETRWAAGILTGEGPTGVPRGPWRAPALPLLDYRSRMGELSTTGNVRRDDLDPLRQRLESLQSLGRRMPTMAWLVECVRVFCPEGSPLRDPDDDTERRRYGRCLDHLITLLDLAFLDKPTTLERLSQWLRLQMATNHAEDEPTEPGLTAGRTTALTVHKAKGLEFDRVLIPYTSTPFAAPPTVTTKAAVIRRPGALPRLIWSWRTASSGANSFSNVPASEVGLWAEDDAETLREEARLLYVAMTRARTELRIYMPPNATTPTSPDGATSWAELLRRGTA